MADEWREMALTLRDALMEACTSQEAVGRLIDLAIIKLQAQVEALRARRVGAADGYVEPDSAATLLEDARRRIKRCSTLHRLVDTQLPICVESMDLVPTAEMRQSWDDHSRDALRNADAAQRSICDAASFTKAAQDAVELAGALPEGDIIQTAWFLAAEQLQNKAIYEVYQAGYHVSTMQVTLSQQFLGASSFLRLA